MAKPVVQGSTVIFLLVLFLKESLSGERCTGEGDWMQESEKITAKMWSRIIKELKQYNGCGKGVEEMAQEKKHLKWWYF